MIPSSRQKSIYVFLVALFFSSVTHALLLSPLIAAESWLDTASNPAVFDQTNDSIHTYKQLIISLPKSEMQVSEQQPLIAQVTKSVTQQRTAVTQATAAKQTPSATTSSTQATDDSRGLAANTDLDTEFTTLKSRSITLEAESAPVVIQPATVDLYLIQPLIDEFIRMEQRQMLRETCGNPFTGAINAQCWSTLVAEKPVGIGDSDLNPVFTQQFNPEKVEPDDATLARWASLKAIPLIKFNF